MYMYIYIYIYICIYTRNDLKNCNFKERNRDRK